MLFSSFYIGRNIPYAYQGMIWHVTIKEKIMKVVGLITEYNPFHNGHKHHIEEAKRICDADYVIAVMSGNFVQRGSPSIIDKYSRTAMALRNGVDLVLEIPVCYATASAEYFALGAVSLLNKTGIVDYLCFGSEVGDLSLLKNAADFFTNLPRDYDKTMSELLKTGLSYPHARMKTLHQYFTQSDQEGDQQGFISVLTEPNNILGIEYMKALKCLSSPIQPITIKRKSAHYHDRELAIDSEANKDTTISSATAIRNKIHNTDPKKPRSLPSTSNDCISALSHIKASIPENVYELLEKDYQKTFPITEDDFSQIIQYKLLSEDSRSLTTYVDITSDLANRMKNLRNYNLSFTQLAQELKSKNLTLTRINRSLIHLLLNIKKSQFTEYNQKGYVPYARILGIKKEASHLLRSMEEKGALPIITKPSKASHQLDSMGMQMLSEDIFAAHVYNQMVYHKYQTIIPNEYQHGITIID